MLCCCPAGQPRSTPSFERASLAASGGGLRSGSPRGSACSRNMRWPIGCSPHSAMCRWGATGRRPSPVLLGASLVALLLYLPNLWWNWQHDFVSYRHVRDNAEIAGVLFHPGAFLEFFASQFAVFGPLCFAALIAIAARPRSLAEPRARLLAAFALPALVMMLGVGLLSRAQPNWAAPTY